MDKVYDLKILIKFTNNWVLEITISPYPISLILTMQQMEVIF